MPYIPFKTPGTGAKIYYEEYGTGYICPEIAYSQGGYESSERASFVAAEVESVLVAAIDTVLK